MADDAQKKTEVPATAVQQASSAKRKRTASKGPSWREQWPLLLIGGAYVIASLIAIGLLLFGGDARAEWYYVSQYMFIVAAILSPLLVGVGEYSNTNFSAEFGFKAGPFWGKVVGAPAIGIICAIVAWKIQPLVLTHKPVVRVYFLGASRTAKFFIEYQTPTGRSDEDGQDNSVELFNIPIRADKLRVTALNVEGYMTKEAKEGKALPWEYVISEEDGSYIVNIQMIEKKKTPTPEPDKQSCIEAIEKLRSESIHDLEQRLAEPAQVDKKIVRLTIDNQTGRMLTLLMFDCSRLFVQPDPTEGVWWRWKRLEVPGSTTPFEFQEFKHFYKPSGWFLLFLREYDGKTDRYTDTPFFCDNLFKSLHPVLRLVPSKEPVGFTPVLSHE